MQTLVNKIWYQGHPLRWLLLPLSFVFGLITSVRRGLFRLGLKSQTTLPVPVIVVGNITVGGSGKTPTVIYLIELLRAHGFNPGVISRGYGANIQGVKPVTHGASATDVGDEPAMIVARTGVPMIVGAKRVEAANALIAEFGVDVIICDDGLQHYALGRDIELVVVDGQRRLGNEYLLPAGPLREGVWRLKDVDFVVINGGTADVGQFEMQLVPMEVKAVNGNVVSTDFDKSQPLVAMAGIGHPARFFDALQAQGYQLALSQGFDDHQAYDKKQLCDLAKNLPLMMTEKDAVKCRDFAQENWWYLAVNAKLSPQFDEQLLSRLHEVVAAKQGNSHGIR
ncbi:tetraacyldisaccharide 4'-kinase [Shewanella profunda]|uniref:tetraacyldisaccharide 4'-kinase n=1 Tax=Shewanella profunda TaxID=254793 RepID=UPI0020102E99|nr:tetraacyldisaccharide 4'-kinase [Shewanella profunda]MCL1089507.1 tetraacyldisaccharide 4'-kinase [Shewanella profunda]